jgi:enoyl-CoA hydratase
MATYEIVKIDKQGAVATVTLDRPKALNALNAATLRELGAAIAELDTDPAVRVCILTGGGEKAFVAGADISEMAGMTVDQARRFALGGGAIAEQLSRSPRPWIAAVNGFALGGGCELALACDFVYASKHAKFGQPEVNLGVIPGFGGTQRLLRRCGLAKAKELIFSGDIVNAEEALRIGLADAVFEPADLLGKARAMAEKIASKGPLAIARAKKVIDVGQSMSLEHACTLEADTFASLFDTADQKEGMKAFLEKRPAAFQGR